MFYFFAVFFYFFTCFKTNVCNCSVKHFYWATDLWSVSLILTPFIISVLTSIGFCYTSSWFLVWKAIFEWNLDMFILCYETMDLIKPVLNGFLWHCSSREGHRVEGITLHYRDIEGEVQASLGPSTGHFRKESSLPLGGGGSIGWLTMHWEQPHHCWVMVVDIAFYTSSDTTSLLLVGINQALYGHNTGTGEKTRLTTRRGKKCQLSAWSSLIPRCGDAEILCSH